MVENIHLVIKCSNNKIYLVDECLDDDDRFEKSSEVLATDYKDYQEYFIKEHEICYKAQLINSKPPELLSIWEDLTRIIKRIKQVHEREFEITPSNQKRQKIGAQNEISEQSIHSSYSKMNGSLPSETIKLKKDNDLSIDININSNKCQVL